MDKTFRAWVKVCDTVVHLSGFSDVIVALGLFLLPLLLFGLESVKPAFEPKVCWSFVSVPVFSPAPISEAGLNTDLDSCFADLVGRLDVFDTVFGLTLSLDLSATDFAFSFGTSFSSIPSNRAKKASFIQQRHLNMCHKKKNQILKHNIVL